MRRRDLVLGVGLAPFAPIASVAQEREARLIGYLSSASAATYPEAYLAAFREGLGETGYVEDKNVTIEYRWAEDRYERLPGLAEDLARRKVEVIAATGGLVSTLAANTATTQIPIVFAMGDDPVAAGLAASFARPGGNLTGVSFLVVELGAKLFELATELVRPSGPIGVLANPHRPSYQAVRSTIEDAARAKARAPLMLDASSDKDFEATFGELTRVRASALIVTSDPFLLDRRKRLVELAAQHAIPAVYAWRAFAVEGGLMSYGVNLANEYRRVGNYVGRILAGEKPGDLPIERPATFELIINLKTAKALGLNMPQSLLARADEIIE